MWKLSETEYIPKVVSVILRMLSTHTSTTFALAMLAVMKYFLSITLMVLAFATAQRPQMGQQWTVGFEGIGTWAGNFSESEDGMLGASALSDTGVSAVMQFSSLDADDIALLSLDAGEYDGFLLSGFPKIQITLDFLICVLPKSANGVGEGVGYGLMDNAPNGLAVFDDTVPCQASAVAASTTQGNSNIAFALGDSFQVEAMVSDNRTLTWTVNLTGQESGNAFSGNATGSSNQSAELEYFTSETAPFPDAVDAWVVAIGNEAEQNLLYCLFSENSRLESNVFAGKILLSTQGCRVTLP